MRDLERAQDGTEINARELELVTDRARNLGDRRDAFEQMRDTTADAYKAETGEQWRPRHGSHTSRTGHLTSAAIDARDFIRARKDRETRTHLPEETLVAGGKTVTDPGAVFTRLDKARAKYADMILVHGGGPGVEKIAARNGPSGTASTRWCASPTGTARPRTAAPFRRNDDLLDLLPKGVIAFPGNGITGNLIDKATKLGIPVMRAA